MRWLINSLNICGAAGFKISKINTATSFESLTLEEANK